MTWEARFRFPIASQNRGLTVLTKLTNDTVRTLRAGPSGDAIYPDSDPRNGVPGLYLRVRASGSRTFILQWRQGQFQRRSTIGKVGVLSLDEARKAARKTLVGIDQGHDPIAAKAKARVDDKLIFETVAKEYLEVRAKDMKPGSLDQCQRHLLKYLKGLHRFAIGKIDRATIAIELRAIGKKSGAVQADRARSTLLAMFGWCVGEGILETNPVVGTNKQSKAKSRERVLTDDELLAVWRSAPDSEFGRIVKLLMLTGQRRDEIAALRCSEIQDDMIALPAERTKNSRPHDVPLSAQALAVLSDQPQRVGREQVFGDGEGGFSGFSRAKQRLDEAISIADWTLHDLRRTMATRMADLGVQPHVIEAILNHVSGHKAGVAGVYNRSTYAAEKRAALDLWGAHVQTLVAKASGANITMFKRA
jgi:integrase